MSRIRMRIREKQVIVVVGQILIPFILLFALYVQFHGDFGPGGGFQAGVIFAAGLILFGLILSPEELQRVITPAHVRVAFALGVLLYGGVGVFSLLAGGNFLDYGTLDAHDPVHGQHLGVLLVEGGVGITVAAALLTVYYRFTTHGPSR